jgi:hypothetical protein
MAKVPKIKEPSVLDHLRQLTSELGDSTIDLTGRKAKTVHNQIGVLVQELGRLMVGLDPIKEPKSFFDPSNPRTVGRFIAVALVAQDRHPLTAIPDFYGSGIYAIYYDGPFEAYKPLVGTENPIYVGKADPENPAAKSPREQGIRLCSRLNEHLKSIAKATTTLRVEDFSCRYLVIQSGAQTAAEDYLIDIFKPIWNKQMKIAYGKGKHGDAPETRGNSRSPWDTLHPGRDWAHRADNIGDAKPLEQIISKIAGHFDVHAPYPTLNAVLNRFFEDLKQH